MSDVSIVMVSYHTGAPLWLAIESALEQPECRELVVVDNGNIPGVQAVLQRLAEREERFKLVTGQGNVGFAKACNLGVRASSAPLVLLLNPDCMLPQGALAESIQAMNRFPENTLAGCYLVNPDGSEQRGCRRALLTPKNAALESIGLASLLPEKERLNITGPMPAEAHEIPAISGAFMLLARSFYEQLNGLDEGYFLHMEDMDLCMRAHKAGGKVICMPEVKVIHFRSTSESPSNVVERHKTQSFIRYLKTHFSDSHSSGFLKAMELGLWLRYDMKLVAGLLDRVFVPPLASKREIARIVLLYRQTRFGLFNDSLMGKTVMVTGASSQIGLCVVGKALARGAQVIALYHDNPIEFAHPSLTWVYCDFKDFTPRHKADILIHAAPLWFLPDMLDDAAKDGVQRVIAFGSAVMLAEIEEKCAQEEAYQRKLRLAEEKLMKRVTERNAAITVLRPAQTYGVGLDGNVTRLADIVRRFGILTVYGEGKGLRNPVQAQDLAEAALNICHNPSTYGKAYNLGGSQAMTYMQMLINMCEYIGRKARVVRPPMLPLLLDWLGWIYQVEHVNGEAARRMNKDLVCDNQPALADFGYHPRGFLQGSIAI